MHMETKTCRNGVNSVAVTDFTNITFQSTHWYLRPLSQTAGKLSAYKTQRDVERRVCLQWKYINCPTKGLFTNWERMKKKNKDTC